jgi:trans-aconitate methyltransferase
MNDDPYWKLGLDKKYNPISWITKRDSEFVDGRQLWHKEWLVDAVNKLEPALVVDVGCGKNKWKHKIKNLIGFDANPFPGIDFQSTILDAPIEPNSVDVLLCLGSIQFVDRNYVEENLSKVISWLKPGGYIFMRVIKKWDQYSDRQLTTIFKNNYFWSNEDLEYLGKKFNLEIVGEVHTIQKQKLDKSTGANPFRLYWVWRKI